MKREHRVIDCFCGAGGLSLGFKKAGFDIVYAFDLDEAAINTYRRNHHKCAFVRDIYKVSKNSIEEDLGHKLGEIDVVIGGPPCQGFSVQRRGSNHDPRNSLVLEYIRLILDINPKFFVMENVGGLLSPRGTPYLNELIERCEEAGYIIQKKKLSASEFGVPQDRKRVFIVGERPSESLTRFSFPTGSLGSPRTVRDAISDLMNRNENDIPNHKADKLSAINVERIRAIKEGEGRDSLPEHLQLDCHKNNITHRHLDVYGRMSWDKPSPTITARFDSFSRGRFGHPELDRTITLREGARLQTFPDDFEFLGNKVEVAKQIGNAVPPLLATEIAKNIIGCLEVLNMPVLNHWPSGLRDTTQFPSVDLQIDVSLREHLEAFTKMDGVGWNAYDAQRTVGELSVTPSRLRTYRKMYEKLGLIYRDDKTLRLSRLGKQIAALESDLNNQGKVVLNKLRATAIDILSRYQLRNPAEESELPESCDVLPCICIWKALLSLDGKLHHEEMNRVILRIMRMSEMDAAIEKICSARAKYGNYIGHSMAVLDEVLGLQVHTDQPDARIAPWFSFVGWGGLIIEQQVAADGFRHLIEASVHPIERITENPPQYYHAVDADDWFAYYIGSAAETDNAPSLAVPSTVEYAWHADPKQGYEDKPDEVELKEYFPVAMKPEQVIFFGAPGTGKSYDINEKIKAFYADAEVRSAHTMRVTFHPDYEYSDFVGALRPVRHPDKGLDYEFIPGPMTRILADCFKHPSEVFFLIIEEINRGNAPAIFGDLFQLLDRSSTGKSIYGISNEEVALCLQKETKYLNIFTKKKIWFPPNLSILCSMNTADQNVFVLDTAFSRRFERVYVRVDFERLDKLEAGAKKNLYLGETPVFTGTQSLTEVFKDTELAYVAAELDAQGQLRRNWPAFAMLVNRLMDIINERDGTDQISEDKKLGPFFASETDLSSREAFANKVIYYLKQDVFRYVEQYFDTPFQMIYDQYAVGKGDLFALLKIGE